MHRHSVQFYADDAYLANRAATFLDQALERGGSALIIATPGHRQEILDNMGNQEHVVTADAEQTLEAFMEDGMPDGPRFHAIIGQLVDRAGGRGKIHAFGEMVTILWARQQEEAAIRLEQLWNELENDQVSLLCAYPMSGFADSRQTEAFLRVCREHQESHPTERMEGRDADPAHVEQLAAALAREVQRREAAEQLASDAELQSQDFLALLGHELRNPLTPLVASLRMLDEANQGEQRELLETLQRQTRRLQELVDGFLGSEGGRLMLQREATTLGAVVHAARAATLPLLSERNQALLVELPPEPVSLEADPEMLGQALGTLLSLASRSTSARGSVTLHACCTDDGVEIAVAKPVGEHEPAPAATSAGLAAVRQVVDLHDGEWLSGAGHGSTFRLRLPSAAPAMQHAPRRVLVVDDQPDVAHTIRDFLRLNGHDATAALSGPEAILCAKEQPPDVILLDLSMPDMDGYETARILRREERLASIRIIALTGHTQPRHVQAAREAGCDQHVAKPPDPDALLRLVQEPLVMPTASAAGPGAGR